MYVPYFHLSCISVVGARHVKGKSCCCSFLIKLRLQYDTWTCQNLSSTSDPLLRNRCSVNERRTTTTLEQADWWAKRWVLEKRMYGTVRYAKSRDTARGNAFPRGGAGMTMVDAGSQKGEVLHHRTVVRLHCLGDGAVAPAIVVAFVVQRFHKAGSNVGR